MYNAHKLALLAALGLALALATGCSLPDEDGGGGNGGSGNSGGGGEGKVNYGNPVTYESETYKTVIIGNQTWFAENLNYNASGSKCYDDDPSNCAKYGRLYDWETAKTACPQGWRLPSDEDWSVLTNYVESTYGSGTAAKHLKAASGWNSKGNGKDTYGFAALPGGYGYSGGSDFAGSYGNWWSSSENTAIDAYNRRMYYGDDVLRDYNFRYYFYSIRCVKD